MLHPLLEIYPENYLKQLLEIYPEKFFAVIIVKL